MTSPNRPPSCDMPHEHYDEFKDIKPCPICGHDEFGWSIDKICFEEFSNDEVVVQCGKCGLQVNDRTYRKSKGAAVREWNSIPRKSEVAELLRLVDHMINSYGWDQLDQRELLGICADKLRKEWNL